MADDQQMDVERVLEDLQRHVLESQQVQEFLGELARNAVKALSHQGTKVYCGVTLLRERKAATAASSGPTALKLDELQYKYDKGPCLSAARSGEVFLAPDLARESRWPEYIHEIRGSGIGAIMAVPFELTGEAQGALNLYAGDALAFDAGMQVLARGYALQVSDSIRLAVRIAQLMDKAEDLRAAMVSRTSIDIAIGIIMGQNGCSQDQAFQILQRASSNRNLKLREVAQLLVEAEAPETVQTHFES